MSYLNAKTLKKSRKLRKKSPKRKSSRKKSPKQKSSRKRRSTKQKSSRKRRSTKQKSSRKRRSTKQKGKKLKFRITSSERAKIAEIFKKNKDDPEALCSICYEPLLYLDGKKVSNKDIVGCAAAEKKGYLCCSKQTGCKNNYFHKVCLNKWFATGKETCPLCREKRVKKKPPRNRGHMAVGALAAMLALNAPGLWNLGSKAFSPSNPLIRCYDPGVNSIRSVDGFELPTCTSSCTYIKNTWDNIPHVFEYEDGPPYDECPGWMADSHENWHANMNPKEWRKSQGIAKDGGESGLRTELMPGSLMTWNKDDLGAKKDAFRMRKKPPRGSGKYDRRWIQHQRRREAAAAAKAQKALEEEARVAAMDEKTRAVYLKEKADKEAHEKKRDEEWEKLHRKFKKEKEEWEKAWLKREGRRPGDRAFDKWLRERREKDSALAERVRNL